ncbi:MAG: hypothetical protein BGO49_29760 [Planctomycetales bacterium 71-10]|nr:MAG: hypothetical protein BGO49_29760 [Planctomycetales bacterium 71-10]
MKYFAAFALAFLACVPARAQLGGMGGRPATQPQNIEAEILEMEQEADKAALKEALLLQAREGMKGTQGTDVEKKQEAEDSAALRDFIARKKGAITARAAKLVENRTAGRQAPAARAVRPPQGADDQDLIEGYEKAKVEIQLLQAQANLLQPDLAKAVDDLASADLAAGTDQTHREKAEAARKEYDRLKTKVVDINKRLYQERRIMAPMQMQMQAMGMGGMGGGFR